MDTLEATISTKNPDSYDLQLTEDGLVENESLFRINRRNIQREMNRKLQNLKDGYVMPSVVTLDDMLNEYVYIQKGELVAHITENSTKILKLKEHRKATTSSYLIDETENEKNNIISVHDSWMQSDKKISVSTVTFAAGRELICSDPAGDRAINLWRKIERKYIEPDLLDGLIKPFIEQIEYLFDDDSNVFLDWLAHLEQKPEELPHFGFLHVAKHTGTGRNWLASVLCRVWRGYVSPNIELDKLLEGSFNSQLAGCILAIVDEIQEGANKSYRSAQRLKTLVNSETRYINRKGLQQYYENNSCRWLVFSNHLNALPIDKNDRRWYCIVTENIGREEDVYTHLYALLDDPDFINAIGLYLSNRDISNFNAGKRPSITESKLKIINATQSEARKNAEEMIKRWPSDIITNRDVVEVLTDGTESTMTPHLRNVMIEVNAIQISRKIKIKGLGSQKLWIIRNHQKWLKLSETNGPLQKEVIKAREYGYKSSDEDSTSLISANSQMN